MNKNAGTAWMEVLLVGMVLLFFSLVAQSSWSFEQGPNNRNVSVDTQVNVTGSAPEILIVRVASPTTLSAGSLTLITCNATIRDYNGFGDISNVNATLFDIGSSSYYAADDNNTHYTNSSCSVIAGQQSGSFANYTCGFYVNYYAVNGTWNCTVLVNDSIGLNDTYDNTTLINALFALNVTTLIDYGDMNIGDTSSNVPANVSNLGNRPINVSVRGYGRNLSDGWGFVCEQGNLTVDLQHFAANSTATYAQKQALASGYSQVAGLSIAKATNSSGSLNTTYWQLFLDPAQNVFGLCNGTIVFQAESS